MADQENNETIERSLRIAAPPLPPTVMDLLNQRKSLRTRSLNDDVEEIHLRLWENPQYRALFLAIWREEAIEGSFIDDDCEAARMVRQHAIKHEVPIAKGAKLASIRHSLKVVARRYGISRKERQNMVGGEVVSTGGGSDDE